MPGKSSNLGQFWQELKRRKVIRVIAMYAATAFIIMEAGDIMFPRLGLPDWTVTFIIILLIVGFPITIILSWIFDVTPEGIKKTETAKEEEAPLEPVRRKLRITDVIIAVLVVIVAILAYPKIFENDPSKVIKDADGRISIIVMPFKNLTGDTLYNLWQEGLQNLIITSLSNSKELSVRQSEIMNKALGSSENLNYASITPSFASDLASRLEASTVILGHIHKSENTIRITANLMDSRNEEIYKSYELEGQLEYDFFHITDTLSILIKNSLEIENLELEAPYDWKKGFTTSSEAFKYYIQGRGYHGRLDLTSAKDLYTKAISIDSNFVPPMIMLSYIYGDMGLSDQSRRWAYEAYDHIDDLQLDFQFEIKQLKAMTDKNPKEQIKYLKQSLEINPYSLDRLYALGWVYSLTNQWQNAIYAFEKAIKLNKQLNSNYRLWVWHYVLLGEAYHEIEKHRKENKTYKVGLKLWADAHQIIISQAVCALSLGDTTEANNYITKYRSILETEGSGEYWINCQIGRIYRDADYLDIAEKFLRQANDKNIQDAEVMNALAYLLINHDINVYEGMELINRALEMEPDNYSFIVTKGWGLHKQGKHSEALEHLKKAWDLIPFYDHESYLHIQEVEQALANQNK